MVLRWVPLREIMHLENEDSRCFVCRDKAEYSFSFFRGSKREMRRYCAKHALKASTRHHIPMPT